MDIGGEFSKKAKAAGAESAADIGVFLLGASVGGLVDAGLNVFGFAEPMVVAPLAGAGALGLKKLVWDAWWANDATTDKPQGPPNSPPSQTGD